MRLKFLPAPVLAAIFAAVAIPTFSQTVPAGTGAGLPLVVGAGFSDYNVDFGNGRRELGGKLWASMAVPKTPHILHGLGLEMEAGDLSLDPAPGLSFMRYDTAGGGAIYHYLRPKNIHPYAKGLVGFGSIDFAPHSDTYSHDTRTYYAFGGGADFHAWGHIWVRADYEYQMWYNLFGSPRALTPNGFTVGPEYDFGRRR